MLIVLLSVALIWIPVVIVLVARVRRVDVLAAIPDVAGARADRRTGPSFIPGEDRR